MSKLYERYKSWGHTPDLAFHPPKAFRLNALKDTKGVIERLEKETFHTTKHQHTAQGYTYEGDKSISSTPEYLTGVIYRQGIASQLPVEVLNPNGPTLDMCAAPGSKTTQLAAHTQSNVPIVALDSNMQRIKSLKANLDRCGVTSVVTYRKDGRFADDLPFRYDYVLLDPPCSGNYTQETNFVNKRTLSDIKSRMRTQRELLEAAYYVLNPGGTMVYSTCSLEPEENEVQIDWFLKAFPDMKCVPTDLSLGSQGMASPFHKELHPDIENTRRFWPDQTKTEGFFIAKLVKDT